VARSPGWILVVARWRGAEHVDDAICVELTAPAREVWGDVALSLGGLHVAPSPAPDQVYVRTRLGYTHYLRPIVGGGAPSLTRRRTVVEIVQSVRGNSSHNEAHAPSMCDGGHRPSRGPW